jgi:hypothetical protein
MDKSLNKIFQSAYQLTEKKEDLESFQDPYHTLASNNDHLLAR